MLSIVINSCNIDELVVNKCLTVFMKGKLLVKGESNNESESDTFVGHCVILSICNICSFLICLYGFIFVSIKYN